MAIVSFYKPTIRIFLFLPTYILFICLSYAETQNDNLNSTQLSGKWVHSDQLKPGMKLVTAEGKVLTIAKQWQAKPTHETTYNLTVKNNHTYFVSEKSIWSHNMADCDEKLTTRIWRRLTGQPSKPSIDKLDDTFLSDGTSLAQVDKSVKSAGSAWNFTRQWNSFLNKYNSKGLSIQQLNAASKNGLSSTGAEIETVFYGSESSGYEMLVNVKAFGPTPQNGLTRFMGSLQNIAQRTGINITVKHNVKGVKNNVVISGRTGSTRY